MSKCGPVCRRQHPVCAFTSTRPRVRLNRLHGAAEHAALGIVTLHRQQKEHHRRGDNDQAEVGSNMP